MLKTCLFPFIVCILLISILGGWASGQCVPDGNDSAATAKPIGFTEAVTDWVCPDDKFDYYSMVIADGEDVSGTITFDSPQTGTVMRLSRGSDTVAERATSDATHQYDIPIASGSLVAGKYYFRVTFYSAYASDHQYTLTLNLTVKKVPIQMPVRTAKILGTAGFINLLVSPWPLPRCDGANRGRSGLSGPEGSALKSVQFNLKDDLGLGLWPKVTCTDLLAGSSNRVYYINHELILLVAYDLTSGYLWKYPISIYTDPFMLDESGNIYFLTGASFNVGEKASVNCINSKAELQWSTAIPGDSNAISRIRCVSTRIYVSTKRYGEGYYVLAFERDGKLAWSAGPLNDELINMAEDSEGYLYFETWQGLYQYESDGNYKWYYEFPLSESGGFFTGAGPARAPVVGHDGRVWLNSTQKPQFLVINRDGSVYKQIDYAPGNLAQPYAATFACIGGDGRFYMADTSNVVICYSDWDQEMWRRSISCPGGKIMDMIMDKDNRIYVLYYTKIADKKYDFHWTLLSPTDGSIIFDGKIPLPDGAYGFDTSDLHIVGGGKLVHLCTSGFITVLDPKVVTDEPTGYSMVPAG